VEALSYRFGSRILFVAAGQSAMGANDMLLKLQGRFTGRVEFTDTDVDKVVRRVILQKAPDKMAFLKERLTEVSGEISRHLQGTRLGAVPEDEDTMVADYPLLPTRRRFWEYVLRAIDRGGSAAQLRTQLRSVQEATKYVAEMPVGVVVPGDFIYEQQVTGMLHSGVLSRNLHETIESLKDGSPDGGLRYRLAALVFLIRQLEEANKDLGMRANAATLADLLVADLNKGSARLRTEVERVLKELVDEGVLQAVNGEYLLQGKVGAEWHQAYTVRVNRIKDETARIAEVRRQLLQEALQRRVGALAIVQGQAKVPRKGTFVYGQEVPDFSSGVIPMWVRDEWSVGSLKAAEEEAAACGQEDPVVHLLIPRKDAQAIKDEIIKMEAARETLDAKGVALTEDASLARAAIQARRDAAEEQLVRLFSGVLDDARVLMSGGLEITEADLKTSVEVALQTAAKRLFPEFDKGDGPWGLVVKRVSEGSGTALEVLGHQGDPREHRVCKEIMTFLGSNARKGAEIREHFKSPPFGWPQDAVDGSLMVLAQAGVVRVKLNGVDTPASQVTQDKLGKYSFALEHQGLTANQRMQLRKLLSDVGEQCKPNEEAEALARFLSKLIDAGKKAGGEPPRPAVPDLGAVQVLEGLYGNERLLAAWERREELRQLWHKWRADAEKIQERMSEWQRLETLARKGASLPEAVNATNQMRAIAENRDLLAEPDPIAPLITSVTGAMRQALEKAARDYAAALEKGVAGLKAAPEFQGLPSQTWDEVLDKCGLRPLRELKLGTEAEVIAAVEATPLATLSDRLDALRGRFDRVRKLLAEAVAPQVISYRPPQRLVSTVAEVESYVAEVREALLEAISEGNPVNIGW